MEKYHILPVNENHKTACGRRRMRGTEKVYSMDMYNAMLRINPDVRCVKCQKEYKVNIAEQYLGDLQIRLRLFAVHKHFTINGKLVDDFFKLVKLSSRDTKSRYIVTDRYSNESKIFPNIRTAVSPEFVIFVSMMWLLRNRLSSALMYSFIKYEMENLGVSWKDTLWRKAGRYYKEEFGEYFIRIKILDPFDVHIYD